MNNRYYEKQEEGFTASIKIGLIIVLIFGIIQIITNWNEVLSHIKTLLA